MSTNFIDPTDSPLGKEFINIDDLSRTGISLECETFNIPGHVFMMYVTGDISEDGAKELEDHCADCLVCNYYLSLVRATFAWKRSLTRKEELMIMALLTSPLSNYLRPKKKKNKNKQSKNKFE